VTSFKCNGCARKTEFLWLDAIDMPDGFKVYQCMDCGCVGVKNITEQMLVVGLGSLKRNPVILAY
jgi:hypothetical protein